VGELLLHKRLNQWYILNMNNTTKQALTKIANGQTNLTAEEKAAISGMLIVSREHARKILDAA
jgi:hypothetical protein